MRYGLPEREEPGAQDLMKFPSVFTRSPDHYSVCRSCSAADCVPCSFPLRIKSAPLGVLDGNDQTPETLLFPRNRAVTGMDPSSREVKALIEFPPGAYVPPRQACPRQDPSDRPAYPPVPVSGSPSRQDSGSLRTAVITLDHNELRSSKVDQTSALLLINLVSVPSPPPRSSFPSLPGGRQPTPSRPTSWF